jgi:hypothetical protein
MHGAAPIVLPARKRRADGGLKVHVAPPLPERVALLGLRPPDHVRHRRQPRVGHALANELDAGWLGQAPRTAVVAMKTALLRCLTGRDWGMRMRTTLDHTRSASRARRRPGRRRVFSALLSCWKLGQAAMQLPLRRQLCCAPACWSVSRGRLHVAVAALTLQRRRPRQYSLLTAWCPPAP